MIRKQRSRRRPTRKLETQIVVECKDAITLPRTLFNLFSIHSLTFFLSGIIYSKEIRLVRGNLSRRSLRKDNRSIMRSLWRECKSMSHSYNAHAENRSCFSFKTGLLDILLLIDVINKQNNNGLIVNYWFINGWKMVEHVKFVVFHVGFLNQVFLNTKLYCPPSEVSFPSCLPLK